LRSFTEQQAGSNSTEQLLSVVNWRTEIRFLIICGETKILLSRKIWGNSVVPVAVTGIMEPLPTIIDEGAGYRWEKVCEREWGVDVIWEEAPESKYHSLDEGWFSVVVLNAEASDCVS
jgi:hypothetical protein